MRLWKVKKQKNRLYTQTVKFIVSFSTTYNQIRLNRNDDDDVMLKYLTSFFD